jgi:hypothetical protein
LNAFNRSPLRPRARLLSLLFHTSLFKSLSSRVLRVLNCDDRRARYKCGPAAFGAFCDELATCDVSHPRGPDYHHGQIKANDNMLISHVMLCGVNQQMSRYIVTGTDELLPLLPHPILTMIAIFCAMLAAPLMAVAVAVSSPVGDLGVRALLAPFQPRGSDLHARQNFLVPDECLPGCDPTLAAVNVSTPHHPQHGSHRSHAMDYHSGIVGLPRCTVPVHEQLPECGLPVREVLRHRGCSARPELTRRPNGANQLSFFHIGGCSSSRGTIQVLIIDSFCLVGSSQILSTIAEPMESRLVRLL